MNRRHFLHTTGGVMAGMALGSGRPAIAERTAAAALPLKRIGTGREVAETVRFLAGDGAGYITGQVIHVNGGLYM